MFTKLWQNPEVVTCWPAALPSHLFSYPVLHGSWKPCSYVPPSHLTKIKEAAVSQLFSTTTSHPIALLRACATPHKVQPGTPLGRTPLWDAHTGVLNKYLSGKPCQVVLNWNSLSISRYSCSILCWFTWVTATQRKTRICVEGFSGRRGIRLLVAVLINIVFFVQWTPECSLTDLSPTFLFMFLPTVGQLLLNLLVSANPIVWSWTLLQHFLWKFRCPRGYYEFQQWGRHLKVLTLSVCNISVPSVVLQNWILCIVCIQVRQGSNVAERMHLAMDTLNQIHFCWMK